MSITKTEVISVRVPPDVKTALVAAADVERRSLASMVEMMVLEYCHAHGVGIPKATSSAPDGRTKRRSAG